MLGSKAKKLRTIFKLNYSVERECLNMRLREMEPTQAVLIEHMSCEIKKCPIYQSSLSFPELSLDCLGNET